MITFLKKSWKELLTAVHWPTYQEISALGFSFVVGFLLLLVIAFVQQYVGKSIVQQVVTTTLD